MPPYTRVRIQEINNVKKLMHVLFFFQLYFSNITLLNIHISSYMYVHQVGRYTQIAK